MPVKIVMGRLPAQRRLDAAGIGNQGGRIAWPSRRFLDRQRPANHPFHAGYHLAHGEPLAIAAIIDAMPGLRPEGIERQHMRFGQIGDMDIIAYAGPVWAWGNPCRKY